MTEIKPRRPRGTGTVRNRGTAKSPRWFAQYGAIGEGGKRRQITQGPFSTKRDAENWLRSQLERKRSGATVLPSRVTVGDFLTTAWLPVVKNRLAPKTYLEYEGMVRRRLVPHLGHVRLQELRPDHIARCYEALRSPGANKRGKKGGRLSEQSIQHAHRCLRGALAYAVKQELIARNPADGVDKPRGKSDSDRATTMQVWEAAELRRFLAATADHRFFALWHLAAFTGMRRGELLGLKWDAVDLEAGTARVVRSRTSVGYEMVEGPPKTAAGRRVIDLDAATVAVLRRWRAQQAQERLAWGEAWTNTGLVFTREDGTAPHADHVARAYEVAVRDAAARPIRFHDLRHTHATLLLKAGVPVKVVAERLGHSSPALTMTVYQHVIPGMGAEAAALFASVVGAQP